MNILITGGSGYLGARLQDYLKKSIGSKYIYIGSRKKVNLGFNFRYMNYNDLDQLRQALYQIDVVVHLSGANAAECNRNICKAINDHSQCANLLLRASELEGVKRFIYISTCHIYGTPLQGEINEITLPRPSKGYSITKRLVEDLVLSSSLKSKIVLRLSNGFGFPANIESFRKNLIVNDICLQAIKKKIIKLNSSGKQFRNFISVINICRSIEFFIDLADKDIKYSIFNLGESESLSILEMSKLVAERCYKMYSYKPDIVRNFSDSNENFDTENSDFKYIIDRLLSAGFILKDNFDYEIDNTLLFCNQNLLDL